MPRRRPNPKVLENLTLQKQNAVAQLNNARVFTDGLDGGFWKTIVKYLEAKLKSIESQLDGFHSLSQTEKDCLLQQRLDLRAFMSMPEDFAKNHDQFVSRVDSLNQQIAQYKERIKLEGTGGD